LDSPARDGLFNLSDGDSCNSLITDSHYIGSGDLSCLLPPPLLTSTSTCIPNIHTENLSSSLFTSATVAPPMVPTVHFLSAEAPIFTPLFGHTVVPVLTPPAFLFRHDGIRFYQHSADLLALPILPAATFLSLESVHLPTPVSCAIPIVLSDLTDSPLQSEEWIQVLLAIAAIRPVQHTHISAIFPDYVTCSSFASFLAVASRFASRDLLVEEAVLASQVRLNHADTGLDVALIAQHERSVLQKGLFATLATAQSLLFSESLSPMTEFTIPRQHPFYRRLHDLAHGRNPVILPPDFQPNFGRSISVLPPSIAPPTVILAHFAKEQRQHRAMILTESVFRAGCRHANVPFSSHNCFVIGKSPVPLHPLGRLLLNMPKLNSAWKKDILADEWTKLCPAQLVDLCQKLINARVSFPGVPIVGARRDVDSAYMRILMHLYSIPLCALLIMIKGIRHVVLLLCNHFGLADSNYHFGVLSAFFLFESRTRLSSVCPLELSDILTDDFCMFGPADVVATELDAVGADFHRYLGLSAVSVSKDVCASTLEMAGAFFDCDKMMMRITQKGFSTLLHYFFVMAPESPSVDNKFAIKSFQRLGSLAIYYANFLSAGLPYSRGFHAATANYPPSATMARWTTRAIGDLFMWRILLLLSLADCSWLTVPVYRPVMLRRSQLHESDVDRGHRQAAAATAVGFSDGCITNHGFAPNGLGGYQATPHGFWFSSDIAEMPFYSSLFHSLLPTDINLIEFIALIITLRCMIYTRIHAHGTCHNCHFHIWSDNTSCLSWVRRNRALQPLHYILLQLFSLLQMRYGILVTVSHIPGWANIYADAPSRNFQCDNLPHIRAVLSLVPQLTISRTFIDDIVKLATPMSVSPLSQVHAGLTLLESLIGAISVA
jgi:hypothetical protein